MHESTIPNKVVGRYSQIIPLMYRDATIVAISCITPPPIAIIREDLSAPPCRISSIIGEIATSDLLCSLATMGIFIALLLGIKLVKRVSKMQTSLLEQISLSDNRFLPTLTLYFPLDEVISNDFCIRKTPIGNYKLPRNSCVVRRTKETC